MPFHYDTIDKIKKKAQAGMKGLRAAYGNFDVLGKAAKRMGEATGTSRSGAPLPNKYRPTR